MEIGKRGPIELEEGMIRVNVITQREPDGKCVARVPLLTETCVEADTKEEAIRLACEYASKLEEKNLQTLKLFWT